MLRQRLITIAVVLPAFLAALFLLPQALWAVLMAGLCLLGAWEWSAFARLDYSGRVRYLLATVAALLALAWFVFGEHAWAATALAVLFTAAALFWLLLAPIWLRLHARPRAPAVIAITGWMVLLPTWAAATSLRAAGALWLLGALSVVWLADTAAYFAGRAFGKHKLAPLVSPGKTVEGALGAFGATALYALVLGTAVPLLRTQLGLARLPLFVAAVLLMTAVSIVADLFESLMKRQVNLKDSGSLLPGHGGILDRIDALTSALPMAALLKLHALIV